MTLFQVISLIFLSLLAYKQLVRLRGEPLVKLLFNLRWTLLTLLAILVIWDPGLSSKIASFLGIARGTDVIIYTSIIWLFYQNYQQAKELEVLQIKLETFVRKLALKKTEETITSKHLKQ